MKKCTVLILILLCSTLSGCSRADTPQQPVCRVVTQIDVAAAHDGTVSYHTFTDSENMETLLNYLRQLHPGTTTDIEAGTFRTDAYEITVSYSDGNQTTYYQIYNDFLKKDHGAWKQVDTDQGATLFPILCSITANS